MFLYLFQKNQLYYKIYPSVLQRGTFNSMERQPQLVTLSVFYSYAPSDRTLCDQLSRHLAPLVRIGMIKEWFEHLISPGVDYEEEKKRALETANLILLL